MKVLLRMPLIDQPKSYMSLNQAVRNTFFRVHLLAHASKPAIAAGEAGALSAIPECGSSYDL